MRNVFIVLKYEFLTTVQKPSFWLTTFLLPGLIILMNVMTQVVAQDAFEPETVFVPGSTVSQPAQDTQAAHPPIIGYVDNAGLLSELPAGIPAGLLQAFETETAADEALQVEEIAEYYIVPADFASSGELLLVSRDFEPFNVATEDLINYLLMFGLTGDEAQAAAFVDPTRSVVQQDLAPQLVEANAPTNPLTFFVPFAVMFIFFFLITMSSGFMLQSVTREKENRTAEVLLLSLRPRELMLGKILGLSLVALLQLAFWLGGGLVALERGRQMLETAAAFTLPPGFIAWGIGFFALGYLLYSAMMGAMGALAPNAREGGQLTFVIILPLLIPLWMNFAFIEAPNGTLATTLSLFPLTAPVAMMTRMAATAVPVWQIVASLAGLAVTTYLFVLLSARFFRADTLLSDAGLSLRRVVSEIRRA